MRALTNIFSWAALSQGPSGVSLNLGFCFTQIAVWFMNKWGEFNIGYEDLSKIIAGLYIETMLRNVVHCTAPGCIYQMKALPYW